MKKHFLMPLIISFILFASISSMADTTTAYSPYWNKDSENNWHYILSNGQVATDAWVYDEVSEEWYLIDSLGNVVTGLVYSPDNTYNHYRFGYNLYYMLDNTSSDGPVGKLLMNKDYYNGIEIFADDRYFGALYESSLDNLEAMGISINTAKPITEMQFVTNGAIASTSGGRSAKEVVEANNLAAQMNGTIVYDWMGHPVVLAGVNNPNGQTYTKGLYNKVIVGWAENAKYHGSESDYIFNYVPIPDSAISKNGVNLLDYHKGGKYYTSTGLTQSQIALLVSEFNIPCVSIYGIGAFEPYSSNGTALISYIDYNYDLVMVGDNVDVMGNYDIAAYGYVGFIDPNFHLQS